jgi:hypothetical protein
MMTITRRKSMQSRRLFESLRMPYLFTAPASFLAVPIESVFKYLKMTDFRERRLPEHVQVCNGRHEDLTKKQYLLAQVADYLINIAHSTMLSIYRQRFKNLKMFLQMKQV